MYCENKEEIRENSKYFRRKTIGMNQKFNVMTQSFFLSMRREQLRQSATRTKIRKLRKFNC
jgi:hypothetical protein